MGNSYYSQGDYKYPEIATLVEDSTMNLVNGNWVRTPAKIMVPILMPKMYSSDAVDKMSFGNNTSIKSSNYFTIKIPKYLYPEARFKKMSPVVYQERTSSSDMVLRNYEETRTLKKGTRLIVVFVGGSISLDSIKVIGLYDDLED